MNRTHTDNHWWLIEIFDPWETAWGVKTYGTYVARSIKSSICGCWLIFLFSKKVKRVEVTGIFNIIRWAENLRDTSVEGELGGDGDGGR
jgi:hypothetical protein